MYKIFPSKAAILDAIAENYLETSLRFPAFAPGERRDAASCLKEAGDDHHGEQAPPAFGFLRDIAQVADRLGLARLARFFGAKKSASSVPARWPRYRFPRAAKAAESVDRFQSLK
ncbi:hypothetical protein HGP14_23610 [Rhizobium sp. P32RR-XVIII]|uniref:hypothetical protein n=1 Tax=Rhizobium sp. P32RR-XVIII TaxID=2726738 RepID=UPI001456C02F|nr:hypothetical protein [Rhizobium sp. P32RR-XVIII]NLS06309.1 hypothetical protein [Rhizobium sp. P32RR-XVIII]